MLKNKGFQNTFLISKYQNGLDASVKSAKHQLRIKFGLKLLQMYVAQNSCISTDSTKITLFLSPPDLKKGQNCLKLSYKIRQDHFECNSHIKSILEPLNDDCWPKISKFKQISKLVLKYRIHNLASGMF